MISIIICSRKTEIDARLAQNLESTIGCDYEIIVIDNSKRNYSIFSAYNKGIEKAKGDILCFMHEDILYHTQNWGVTVEKRFKDDTRLGLIGNLGSHYLANCVCGVGDSGLISSNYYSHDTEHHMRNDRYFDNSGVAEVVVVDGMWYCMARKLFNDEGLRYDESYGGFHYYDMDISMQVWKAGYKCKVVDDVKVEHFSHGTINRDFLDSSFKFYEKWKDYLPITKGAEFTDTELELSAKLSEISAYCRELNYYHERYYNSFPQRCKRRLKQMLHMA